MVELQALPGEFFIYRFSSLGSVPFDSLVALGQSTFWNLAATPDEVSLVSPQLPVDEDAPTVGPWRAFRVAGNLDFALTGILHSLTAPLALAKISVFAVSTFDTDYLMVKSLALQQSLDAWADAGIAVSE